VERRRAHDRVRLLALVRGASSGRARPFPPRIDAQDQSPFVGRVLGGIAATTERIALATGVTSPLTLSLVPAFRERRPMRVVPLDAAVAVVRRGTHQLQSGSRRVQARLRTRQRGNRDLSNGYGEGRSRLPCSRVASRAASTPGCLRLRGRSGSLRLRARARPSAPSRGAAAGSAGPSQRVLRRRGSQRAC
jgi:hypothetical protein